MFDYTHVAEIVTHNYTNGYSDARWIISASQAHDGTVIANAAVYTPDMTRNRAFVSTTVNPTPDGVTAVVNAVKQVCKPALGWDVVTLTDADGAEWILTPDAWPEIVRVALNRANISY